MLARFPRTSGLTVVALALVSAIANPAAAPPGDLDTTFDGDGRVTTDFSGDFDQADGVAIQSDGKIVAAGQAIGLTGNDFALARYNTNGSLDTTFDGDGLVTTDIGGGNDQAFALAIQADGKTVAAGFTSVDGQTDFAVARYNTNGSLDTTFDLDGLVTTDFASGGDEARAVAIQADGKIVVAGLSTVGSLDFGLARYNMDGSLDTGFDADGKATTNFAGNDDDAQSVAIQADGKIVAAGTVAVSGTNDFGLARYNSNGSLDTSFDGDGLVTLDFDTNTDEGRAVAIQADGKIVAAGLAVLSGGNAEFGVARYNSGGSLDSTFDGDGVVTTDFGNFDRVDAVAIQGNGKIVAAGHAVVSGTVDFALVRYNSNGSLDTTFNVDGRVTTDFTGMDEVIFGVAIQANKRIVAAGRVNNSGNYDFGLTRYTCLRPTSRPMSIPLCP
jgi:uncharacterized delta-60 repeat protein